MGLGKTYSTRYLLDSNNSSGVAGQVLSTTSTGIDWVDANTVPGSGLWLENGNDIYNSNSANVGIGTTSPDAKLDVEGGDIKVTYNSGYNLQLSDSGGLGKIYANGDSSSLAFGASAALANNATERMRIVGTTGNVGIGVSNPETSRLLVRGSTNDSTSQIFQAASLAGATRYAIRPDGDNKWYKSDNSLSMILTSAGNVGIGVTGPIALLQVDKNQNAKTALLINNANGGSGASATLFLGTNLTTEQLDIRSFGTSYTTSGALKARGNLIRGSQTGGLSIVTSDPAGDIRLYTGGSADANERMRIDTSGNVGIGVTGPDSRLTVSSGTTNAVANFKSTDSAAYIALSDNSSSSALGNQIGVVGDDMWFATADSEKMRILSDGNVIIGSSTLTGSRSLTLLSATNATNYDINFQQAGTTNHGRIRFTEGASDFQFFAQVGQDPNLTLQYGGNSFFSRGNVGIGTTTPGTKLTVKGAATAGLNQTINIETGGVAAEDGGSMSFSLGSFLGSYPNWRIGQIGAVYESTNSFDGALVFKTSTAADGGTEKMRIASDGAIKFNTYGAGTLVTDSSGNITAAPAGPGNVGYLPLSAGSSYPLTGNLFINNGFTLSWGADTTKIAGNSSTNALSLITASTTRIRITSTGNVGIGTTSPSARLVVSDAGATGLEIFPNDAGNSVNIMAYDRVDSAYREINLDGSNYNFEISNSTKMVIDTSGNVGIGTTSPALQSGGTGLHIDATTSSELKFTNDTTGSTASDGTALVSNGNNFSINNREAGAITLGTSNSPRITILSGGNVGIGTTSPTNKLHVYSGNLDVSGSNAGTGNKILLTTDQNAHYIQANGYWVDVIGNQAEVFRVFGGTGGTSEYLRVTGSGNSLFNYTNQTIETYGSGAYGGKVVIKASGAEGLALLNNAIGGSSQVAMNFTNEFVANQYNYLARIIAEPEQSWSGTASTRSSRLTFFTNNAGTIGERLRITSAGEALFSGTVGINMSTSPTEKLDVDGNIKVHGDLMLQSGSSIVLTDQPTANTGGGTIVNWSVSDTVTAGLLYVLKTNGAWTTTDADVEARSTGMLAIALASNAINGMLLQGFLYKASHGFTIGIPLYISNTAGAFTTTRPTGTNDYVRIIGYATSANYIYFDPDKTWVQVA